MDPSAIITSREFAAPREKVFRAFSDPAQLEQWWGPDGFTNTFDRFDFQPGGEWKFTMHSKTGVDYPNESKFLEINEPDRIVFDHVNPDFRMTMSFEPTPDGGTKLTWHMLWVNAAEGEKLRDFLTTMNQQNYDRLEKQLALMD